MQVIINELPIHYELTGKGKLIVLLHGWGDSAAGLQGLQNPLKKTYQVLAVDLPGFGASQAPAEAWGLDEYATFLNVLLKKLNLADVYALIGHSNGGAIGIKAISHKVVEPKKLVLLASAGVRDQQKTQRKALKAVAKTGKAATFWLPTSKREKLRKRFYTSVGSDLLVAPGMEETFKKVVQQDVQADCKHITQPTLLIYGDEDQATPVSYGERYNQLIKNSELKILPAGHFVHIDREAQVVTEIREFLK